MLILSRKTDERIHIGEGIILTVVDIHRDRVRIGIDAPKDVPIFREEVLALKALAAARERAELAVA